MRRIYPASAGNFTCGSVYLRPSQVILHTPDSQCSLAKMATKFIYDFISLEKLFLFFNRITVKFENYVR